MESAAKWIRTSMHPGDICPIFRKEWRMEKGVRKAQLLITAHGVYEAVLNGKRVGDFILAPGWTSYDKRLQYQIYDITELLQEKNQLLVTVGKGWYVSPMPGFVDSPEKAERSKRPAALFAEIHLWLEDGTQIRIPTDETWEFSESPVRFCEIYDGEVYDANYIPETWDTAVVFEEATDNLIEQEGEIVREQERIQAKTVFTTPKGETVVDFGQEITGYVEFTVNAAGGEKIHILHGEVLDSDGNFYNENYRAAKAEITYICKEGVQTWHPILTFFGFRYIKVEGFPNEVNQEQFTAIAVYSDMKRTGEIKCSNPELNQLFSNILWGQRGNFLDVPTDCPQRDERLGWTGDAQTFIKTASYNYDVEKFFTKWLRDLTADQYEDGGVPHVIPDFIGGHACSAGWADAAVICPWQIYLTYGNAEILQTQFSSMKKWVDYITNTTTTPYLWTGGEHFGDWLGLDAPSGSYKGSSREDFIASAFYANSVRILIEAGNVLNKSMTEYEELHRKIVETFQKNFTEYLTQTECVLAVWFGLAPDPQQTADQLANMIRADGYRFRTGFIGTPYILHVLSRYGYTELAYTLLLRRKYPSWLYPIQKGATTIWEHWDGIMENGSMWSSDMNSFNHYSYGSVADWIYEEAAGIHTIEAYPGFKKVRISPKPDSRLQWLEAAIDTRCGRISSKWTWVGDSVRYEIETPVDTEIVIGQNVRTVKPGRYTLWHTEAENRRQPCQS